jgi:hypothetical protein
LGGGSGSAPRAFLQGGLGGDRHPRITCEGSIKSASSPCRARRLMPSRRRVPFSEATMRPKAWLGAPPHFGPTASMHGKRSASTAMHPSDIAPQARAPCRRGLAPMFQSIRGNPRPPRKGPLGLSRPASPCRRPHLKGPRRSWTRPCGKCIHRACPAHVTPGDSGVSPPPVKYLRRSWISIIRCATA